jgi:PAS domain S-box-containing protein
VDASSDITPENDPIVRSAADATALGMTFLLETRDDGGWRFLFAGPRCLAVNGFAGEALVADASLLQEMIQPEHRAAFIAAVTEAGARMEPFDVEVAMRGVDGQARWRRFAALPRPQPDGAIIWDGLQIDVTDRRQMAAALVEQRRRMEVAVDATGLGFWEWDIAARKVTWSERNKALYGLPPDAEITVERYLQMVHPDDVDGVRAAFIGARDKPQGGDYSLEHRIVTPGSETRWISVNASVAKDSKGEAHLVVGTSLDITERKAADERLNLQMGELAHRAKNGIAILMAIVSQTARGQDTVEGFLELIMSRLQAMSSSQDLVTAAGGHPVELGDVIAQALAPFGHTRVDVDPAIDEVTVRGEMAIGMGLLLHEMATNAVKYGALSNSRGRVTIALEAAPEGQTAFAWRESHGPEIVQPNPPGFGTRLLQMVLRPQGGEVKFSFEPEGFRAHVEFPTVR